VLSRLLIDLTCLSVPETGTRGIGRYAADLARAVASRARGNGLTVLGAERLDRDRPDGITTDVDGAIARLQSPDRAVKHQAWARLVRCGLAAAAKRNGADLVHSPDPNATPVGQIACPRVVTCHDLIGLAYPQEYLTWRDGWSAGRRMIERRRYTRADHIIAVSEGTARDLVRVLGIAERRITVVRNGIDLTRFSPSVTPDDAAVRERHGLAGLPYLLYVGAVEWRKNVDGMIAAIEMLRRRGIEQPALAWAGRLDGRELDIIRRLTAERGPHVDIRLLGWVPDAELSPLMRGAIALLFVSRMEGFGYPMIEAMASGCPVVASDRPFTVELAGDAAVRVDPERADEIADAAAALLANPAERRRLAERGLVRAQAFDVWRMADETLDVYRHVVATSTTGRM
jgi:glycosyltransferase involved in cell wall biosynthesis